MSVRSEVVWLGVVWLENYSRRCAVNFETMATGAKEAAARAERSEERAEMGAREVRAKVVEVTAEEVTVQN